MYNHIIITGSLFGSIYMFGKTLTLINRGFLKEIESKWFYIINGIIMIICGTSIPTYSLLLRYGYKLTRE